MKIIQDNIWKYQTKDSYIGITTNGFVKNNGECVMGRGIALEAKIKYPFLPKALGKHIKEMGNTVCMWHEINILSFPVKHNWWEKADLKLIEESAKQIFNLLEEPYQMGVQLPKFYLPKPGCGNGQLLWKDVEPILDYYLKDLVTIVDRK